MRDKLLDLFDTKIRPQLTGISPRKLSICRLLFLGMSNDEVGREIGIQEKTVKFHLTDIFKTLNITRSKEICPKLIHLSLNYEEFVRLNDLSMECARQMRLYKEMQKILPNNN